MKTKLIKGLTLATLISASPLYAADYVIDTKGAHASIEFRVSHLGISWLTGRFNTFNGDFSYDAKNPAASSINVEVDVTSFDSNHAERNKHIRGDKYLNVEAHPTASFKSTSFTPNADGGGVMKGMLTLYGTTKEVAIDVNKVGEGEDPWGGYRVGFSGTLELTPKEFGMNYELGPAAETVYMDLNIEGIRK
ncbi:YceI family protein [Neptuniibacter sp. 1_MG-2023]|uniref:YceI family protein n=1 Tax=Neptuniibacter sp. 1_MG-2023 TaxID=3062662 RepID=UPI0026E354F9|nr:YceI family protein [Neptuniibacter sp. 1_MG-2023]MDO6593961.1 YceI family protein [Neptuniibacter sp. 1_MG-2023]